MNAAAPCALSDGDDIVARRSSDPAPGTAPRGVARGDPRRSRVGRSRHTRGARRELFCVVPAMRGSGRTAETDHGPAASRIGGSSRPGRQHEVGTRRTLPRARGRNTSDARSGGRASDHQQHGFAAARTLVVHGEGRRCQQSPGQRGQDRRQRVDALGIARLSGHHGLGARP
jgi:hypothetical protein